MVALGLILLGGLALAAIFRSIVIIVVLVVMALLMYLFWRAGLFQRKSGVALALAVIIVLPLFVFVMMGPGALEPSGMDGGKSWWWRPAISVEIIDGGQIYFDGAMGGASGVELMDSSAYAASSRQGGVGDTVWFQARACQAIWDITGTAERGDLLQEAYYDIYFTSNMFWGDPISTIKIGTPYVQTCKDNGRTNLDTGHFTLDSAKGITNGYLRVTLRVKLMDGRMLGVGHDSAYIRDGTGIIDLQEGMVAEVGKAFDIPLKLGFGCSNSNYGGAQAKTEEEGGGWALAIYSSALNWQKVLEKDLGCGSTGLTPTYFHASYTPTDGDFKTGSNCGVLRLELYNYLFQKDTLDVYPLDLKRAVLLPKPTLTASDTNIEEGQSVTFTANSTSNPDSYLWVAAYDDGEDIKRENTTSNTWSVTFPRAGEATVTVNCRKTSDCSISSPESIKIHVTKAGGGGGDVTGNIWGWLIVAILVMVAMIGMAFVPIKPPWLKWLVTAAVALGVVLISWYFRVI